eukprot:TRINITY_DN13597_c0_g1_i1.p1 TRINITY_DN13597_c0_g1~~TRINITY_DN13597_c0_g1_i1.p1  ORF type:complete len:313 (-),score=50.89 TRINITY_DN13597_c0_g1_i1:98-991(-)
MAKSFFAKETELRNPGRMDQYCHEARVILSPDFWEGVRFDYNKPITPNFSIGHGFAIGDPRSQPMYHFNATYASALSRWSGRIDTTGLLIARVDYQFSRKLRAHVQAQMMGPQMQGVAEADYSGSDWTASASASNFGNYAVKYLQAVTPRLAVGLSFSADSSAAPSLAAVLRHATKDSIFTAQFMCLLVSPMSPFASSFPRNFGPLQDIQLQYVHKVGERVSVATELRYDVSRLRSFATVGYRYDLRMGMFTGHIASNGTIGAVLEHHLQPGLSFLLSGNIDYVRQEYGFGFGMNIG